MAKPKTKAEQVANVVNRDMLSSILGEIVEIPGGLLVGTGVTYPGGEPVRIALVLSNGRLMVTDYGHGVRQIVDGKDKSERPTRPGYYLGKAARLFDVRYEDGIVYTSAPKDKVDIKTVLTMIRGVSTASQNGVVLTPSVRKVIEKKKMIRQPKHTS